MDDLISRQDVLNLCDMRDKYKIPYEYDDGNKHIKGYDEGRIINVTKLKMLPSINLQEKTGHWILLDECSNSGYYCSECQKKVVKEGWSNTVKKIKYCPNCGARMVKPQEREEV